MQVEEIIRDLKNHRSGFGVRYALTRRPECLEALLLVAAPASFIVWLYGLAASARRRVRHFQANTKQPGTVLSVVLLGQKLWCNPPFRVTVVKLFDVLKRLKHPVMREAQYA